MKTTPMTPRQVAEDVEGSGGRTRVLAAAIDATDHQRNEYHIYELVADLGDDQIDDLMEDLVFRGLAAWKQRPLTALGGERSLGWIRPTEKGRSLLQTAIDEEEEAKSVRARIKRYGRTVVRGVRQTAGFLKDIRTIIGAVLAVVAGVVVLIRGC